MLSVDQTATVDPVAAVDPAALEKSISRATQGLLGYRQHELNKRAELVRDAVEVSRLAAKLPNVELWQDFEAINRASLASLADDEELWAALK